jgi:hypothetical protein
MPLLLGNRVRLEGAGHITEQTWQKRREAFPHELPTYQRQKLFAAAGKRELMRLPGLAANLTAHEITVVSRIFGKGIERGRKARREEEHHEGAAR